MALGIMECGQYYTNLCKLEKVVLLVRLEDTDGGKEEREVNTM